MSITYCCTMCDIKSNCNEKILIHIKAVHVYPAKHLSDATLFAHDFLNNINDIEIDYKY